jgi:hypothetical protein
MNLSEILTQLKQERNRLDTAIAALESVSGNGISRGTSRGISPAGRARIAAAQRARWARFKKAKKK